MGFVLFFLLSLVVFAAMNSTKVRGMSISISEHNMGKCLVNR